MICPKTLLGMGDAVRPLSTTTTSGQAKRRGDEAALNASRRAAHGWQEATRVLADPNPRYTDSLHELRRIARFCTL
jgi:hypothetical protein